MASPQPQLFSQQGIWGNARAQCPGPKGDVLHLVPFTNTVTIEKGVHQRGQSTVLFNQGLHCPLESWLRRARTQEARGRTGVRVAHWQCLGSSGLHAASLARISEWGRHGGLRVKTGATKWRPGGTSGEEASGRLHGGGPSSLLLYTNRAGVGPPGWQVDVGGRARLAAATGLRAAILQDVLNGGHSAPLL